MNKLLDNCLNRPVIYNGKETPYGEMYADLHRIAKEVTNDTKYQHQLVSAYLAGFEAGANLEEEEEEEEEEKIDEKQMSFN